MKLTFLGTGTSQGVPVIACSCPVCQSDDNRDKRLRTSALIEVEGINLVIDSGPDFRQQMLNNKVKTLDAIIITHEHRDHLAGLDDVRAFNWIHKKPMDIWVEPRVHEAIIKEYSYIFSESKYPGIPEVNIHTIDDHPFSIRGIDIIPIRCYHGKLPILGYRIGDITYITDASFIPEKEKEKITGSKYLIINALRKQKHLAHFSLPEAIRIINEYSPRRGYLTHLSHQIGLYKDVSKELPENVCLAYDGLAIEF